MAADRPTILAEVNEEREHQEEKWGSAFDDKNTVNDFVAYITRYAASAAFDGFSSAATFARTEHQRQHFVKVAALAVAAIEAIDRNGKLANRHYDS